MPANQLPSPGFQQQGSVDWVQLSKSSFTFSIEVLGRLSRAGIETLTVAVGQTICSPFSITGDTQRKIMSAIDRLNVKPSYGDILWFGFGFKSIVGSLLETEQGLVCVAICACLSSSYDEYFAAQILSDMAFLRAAPKNLRPSLSQWAALIKVCTGTLAASNFSNLVEGFSRLWWESQYNGKLEIMRGPTSSKALSNALHCMADVSNGTMASLTLAGGSDCAWLAAVPEWLSSLQNWRLLIAKMFSNSAILKGT